MWSQLPEEAVVAVAFIQEWKLEGDDRTTTNYDAVQQRLGASANPPEGGIFHTAGFDEQAGVFRIFDVWETREQGERFIEERLMPIIEELGRGTASNFRPPDREAWYDLHDVMPG
jgi:hypothetical protein